MQRNIIFTHTGHSAQLGNFTAGDQARVPDILARHLVEQARCAKYLLEIQNGLPPAAEQTQAPTDPVSSEPALVEATPAEGAEATAADEPKRRIRTAKE
ncbi:hypothetical protein [Eleftheria terrae]|uniref:hypothetical protein n=1 Tax=Eleftheria terrae TaxID=1597781 RepID=UPI00263BAF72|nr:hypothetical protein [Eleftheria terrae]WKB52306.1 hypothetical protein N7L95_21320 [Eleftheria terrae]